MAKGADIVVLAKFRSNTTTARSLHPTLVGIQPIDPHKTCKVLMFNGRSKMISAIRP